MTVDGFAVLGTIDQQAPEVYGRHFRRAVRVTLVNIESRTKVLCPKRTGFLANSYAHEVLTDFSGIVGTNTFYAPFVEHGTYKMAAQPHLGPAAEAERQPHASRVRKAANDAHKEIARKGGRR